MNASAASRRSGGRSGSLGMTNVCESACIAGRPKIVGHSAIPNGISVVWNVVISHSPLKSKPAAPVAKNATAPW